MITMDQQHIVFRLMTDSSFVVEWIVSNNTTVVSGRYAEEFGIVVSDSNELCRRLQVRQRVAFRCDACNRMRYAVGRVLNVPWLFGVNTYMDEVVNHIKMFTDFEAVQQTTHD